MPRTNGELMRYVGHMLETTHEEIIGFVLVAVRTDKHIAILSNGNSAQVARLLSSALEEASRREEATNASIPDTAEPDDLIRARGDD
jgi:hypothetical protein